jgi:hypothetical protein
MADGTGEQGEAGERKTRKIRMSDAERDVLIRTIEAQLGAATDDGQRSVLQALLGQITPKKRPTTQRYKPVFQVRWREGTRERDCGHEHQTHLEATDCVKQVAARGVQGTVVPLMRPVAAG